MQLLSAFASHEERKTEGYAVTRDFAEILPAAPQCDVVPPSFANFCDLDVDGISFVKEMPAAAAERSKFSSKHCFANVTIIAAGAIESLLATVVNAWNSQGAQVERYGAENQLVSLVIRAETRLVVPLSNLIVVVDHGYNLNFETTRVSLFAPAVNF